MKEIFVIFKFNLFRKFANLEPDEMAFTDQYIKKLVLNSGFRNCNVKIKDFLLPNIPKTLINPSIYIGEILEKTFFTKIAQSIFIVAEK